MTAWNRLHAATLELVSSAPIKQRLSAAFSNHLKHIDTDELPEEVRASFLDLSQMLESVKPLPGETAVQATVRKMSPDQIDRCAIRIVELLGELNRAQANLARAARDKRENADTVVPLFAAEA
jgi:hypothetical protein